MNAIREWLDDTPGMRVLKITGMVIGGLALAVLLGFLFGYFVKLLWNWLMPELFGLKEITYWQGVGIVILAKIIFGGHGGHGRQRPPRPPRGHVRDHFRHGGDWRYYRDFWKEQGESAFRDYVEQKKQPGSGNGQEENHGQA